MVTKACGKITIEVLNLSLLPGCCLLFGDPIFKRRNYAFLIFLLLILLACQAQSVLVEVGLITPSPTPDPFVHYRAALQPSFQADIETLDPLPRYHITAKLNEDGTALKGVMRVLVPASGPELVFRLYPNLEHYDGLMEINEVKIDDVLVSPVPLADNTAIQLNLPPLDNSARPDFVSLDLAFTTHVEKTSALPGSYTLFGWHDSILSLPGFYPTLAVQQAGEWIVDTPPLHADVLFNEVGLYQLDLTLPENLIVAASGVVLNIINNPDQTRTWQITGGPLRDMTVMAGPFQAVSQNAAGATVTAYYLPGHEAAAQTVLAHATAALRLYSDTYGPYPYTELDVVEAPLNVRGMEYSGLVLIGTDLYEDQREFLPFLVAHEVGHQWWYSLIGNNPYQHPWLDEGLTEYGAFDYYGGVFGQLQAERLLTGRWQIPFDIAAAGGLDGTVDQPAAAFDPVSYELLVYNKAALFFNALREEVGEEMYLKILQTYYAENRYRIASPQIFLATAERVSGQNLNVLAEDWLR